MIVRAIRNRDAPMLLDALRGLGDLADDGDWNGSLLLDHVRTVSWWLQADGPLRLAPEDISARAARSLRDEPQRAAPAAAFAA